MNNSIEGIGTGGICDVDTSDWKTYTSKDGSFSFKYSNYWVLDTLIPDGYVELINLSPESNKDAPVSSIKFCLKQGLLR